MVLSKQCSLVFSTGLKHTCGGSQEDLLIIQTHETLSFRFYLPVVFKQTSNYCTW